MKMAGQGVCLLSPALVMGYEEMTLKAMFPISPSERLARENGSW